MFHSDAIAVLTLTNCRFELKRALILNPMELQNGGQLSEVPTPVSYNGFFLN